MRISWFDDASRNKTEKTVERRFFSRLDTLHAQRSYEIKKKKRSANVSYKYRCSSKKPSLFICQLYSKTKLLIQSIKTSCHYDTHTKIIHMNI